MSSNEIDPSIFLQLLNPDKEQRKKTTEFISQLIPSIDFFQYLLKLLVTPEIIQNSTLLTQILIVLNISVKKLYNDCTSINEVYAKAIPISLIELLNTMPIEYHTHIIDCFRHMNEETYNKGNSIMQDEQSLFHLIQMSTISTILEQLKAQNNFLSNLSIFKIFLKYYIREQDEERNQDFFKEIFQTIVPILFTVLNSEEINEFTAQSAKLSAQLLFHMVNHQLIVVTEMLNDEMTFSMVSHYSNYFTTLFQISSSLNRHLLKLNSLIFHIYYGNDAFIDSIVPIFFQTALSTLSNPEFHFNDVYIQTWALKLLYLLLEPTNRFPSDFDYPQFVKAILIPFAAVVDDEMSDMLNMPYLISSYFVFDEKNPLSSPRREICGKIGSVLLKNPDLYSIVLELDQSNLAFFESCLFLISCIGNDYSLFPNELIEFIISSDFSVYPPFVQASFLYLLNKFAKQISECGKLVDLAILIICSSDQPIVILAALDLLRNPHLDISTSSDLSQLNILVPKVLSLFEAIHYWDSIDVLAKTIVFDENLDSYLSQLIMAIFQSCFVCVQQSEEEDDDENCFGLLNSISLLIAIFEKITLTDEIIQFSYQQLALLSPFLKDIRQMKTIFNLLSFFNYQLRPPLDIQFEYIMMCYASNSEVRPFLLDSCYPLILNPESNLTSKPEFVSLMIETCEGYIQLFESGENCMYVFNEDSLIRLCGSLIEIFGNQCLNLSRIAFIIFESNFDTSLDTFSSLLYLLFVSIKTDCDAIFSLFNENVMRAILCNSIPSIFPSHFSKNEIKCHYYILLLMTKKGFENFSEILAQYTQRSFEYALEIAKSFTSADDWDTDQDEKTCDNFDKANAVRFYPNCLNEIDAFQFFDEVVSELGITLSESSMKLISELRKS